MIWPFFCRYTELTEGKEARFVVYLCQTVLSFLCVCVRLLIKEEKEEDEEKEDAPTVFDTNSLAYTDVYSFLKDSLYRLTSI
jgi:hypothetical protein